MVLCNEIFQVYVYFSGQAATVVADIQPSAQSTEASGNVHSVNLLTSILHSQMLLVLQMSH